MTEESNSLESIKSSYDESIEFVVNSGNEPHSEESDLGVINHDAVQSTSGARPLSPCDIGILVTGTLRYLNEESGSTLREIKK